MIFPIPDAALDDRLGFVGTAGSGKTYNAGTGLERILASGGRVIIPDPLGVWWGLGLCADGKTPAPWREKLVVFGGEHGDMPLFEHSGALIGETVAGMAESAILDLSSIGTKAAERRFMLAFLTALYKHANNEPVHLAFDEADMWAPQRLLDKEGESAKLLGMMETVVRRGRIRGFIPWLITQRPAVLSKDVLSQVDGLVAFKLTSSQDRDAIGAWIEGQADKEQGKAILGSLPALPRGTGVVWLPGRDVLATSAFPLKLTFDSSRTPKRGERVVKHELKPLDLEALKGKLASIEEEAKANDPRALKGEVQRLTRELAKAERTKAAPLKPEIIHANAEEVAAAREEGRMQGMADGLSAAAQAIASLGGKPSKRTAQVDAATFAKVPAERMTVNAGDGLNGPQQRVLNSLAWWAAFGIDRPSSEQVAFIAGYSPIGGAYGNPRSALKSMGLIAYPSPGKILLTAAGAEKAEAPDAPTTRDELHRRVMSKLNGPQQRVLKPLLEAYPESLANDDLAAKAGYSPIGGAYGNPRSSLKALSLIDYPERGVVRAEDWLFP